MGVPEIHRYLDYRAYLRDWFEAQRARDPGFSRRSFARLAGKSSPGLLTEILDGRRVTPKTARSIARGMGMTRPEADFFEALVQLDQATTLRERNHAWQRISASRVFQEARKLEGASFRYVSEWWIPVVRELSRRRDFHADPAWVARRVRPSITEAQARRALETLEQLGMLVDGEPAEGVVTTPEEVAGLAVHNHHRGMLERAIDAIDTAEPDERHYLAATVSVPRGAVAALKEELDALQERILDLCGHTDEAEQVVQVHLLLFPLSDRADVS